MKLTIQDFTGAIIEMRWRAWITGGLPAMPDASAKLIKVEGVQNGLDITVKDNRNTYSAIIDIPSNLVQGVQTLLNNSLEKTLGEILRLTIP